MIQINLLPHREARRAADLRQTVGLLILGLIVVGGGIWFVDKDIKDAQAVARASVLQLEADIEGYAPEEQKVKSFKEKKKELEEKLEVIRDLDAARSGPVRLLDELSKTAPERLWLTKLETAGTTITLTGQSLDEGVVADFLRSLNASAYFALVDLERTNAGAQREGVRLVQFVITAELVNRRAEGGEGEAQNG